MPKRTTEQRSLLKQLENIATGIAETFAPFCEVVVHDLLNPHHSVQKINNNLSGRAVGDPATALGLVRIADPKHPDVIANYANQFADGRQVKSTSIGVKDSTGRCIAALCLNVDLTMFHGFQNAMGQFVCVRSSQPITESLHPGGTQTLRDHIDEFAAKHVTTPRSLNTLQRRDLMMELKRSGYLNMRRAMETIALHLGVSRATVYNDTKK